MEPNIKTVKKGKTKNKNRYAQKKRSGRESKESVPKERKSLWQEGHVKQVGFKLGVKE